MKKIIFTLLGLMMITSSSATESGYVPLVHEGRKWVYLWYEQIGSGTIINPLYLYSLDIRQNGEVYYTLLDKEMNPIGESSIVALLSENIAKRVVERYSVPEDYPTQPIDGFLTDDFEFGIYLYEVPFWYNPQNGVYEIYDFSVNGFLPVLSSDLITDYELWYIELLRNINRQTNVEVGDEICNAYILNDGDFFFEAKVIEGIGIDSRSGDLLTPQPSGIPMSWAEWPGLVAVYDTNELIYKGCLYEEAMQFASMNTVEVNKQVVGIRYYNLAGVESAEPFKGVNLKVTTYTDGTRSSEKVIK